MSRILVTGSADGLGRLAAESLLADGHTLVVHARHRERAVSLSPLTGQGAKVVVADLADREAVSRLASELGDDEPLDAVIHNAGVWSGPAVMPVNIVAPYLLTALVPLPRRVIYLSSGSHYGGRPSTAHVDWQGRGAGSYEDSKLFVTTLMAVIARRRPDVLSNAVDPGWVPTRMGGPSAPDDLEQGHRTQEWLASSNDAQATTTGGYWYHRERRQPHASVHDEAFQGQLLKALAAETGVELEL
jgi:NAD(P)-dependent dehydrogenase (short-subunit alcohol dehydrogenase family)